MLDRRGFLIMALAGVLVPISRNGYGRERPRLLLVHGRAQQGKDPARLKTEWLEAFKRGAEKLGRTLPDDLEVDLPFYGDTLDDFARRFELPLTTDIQTKGAPVDAEFLRFQADMAEALRHRAGVTDAQIDAEYGANPKTRGPENWEWVQAILRALDKYGGGLSQTTLETFMRDVFLYTARAGVRDEIDRIVAAKLPEKPTVVVGHSLGSVVAYNVLRSDRRSLEVPLFVTLGCPLGIRAIRNEFRPLRYPEPVEAWYNAFDERDVVALYPLDSMNFPVRPAVENSRSVKNHTDNRHGIAGYLDDPDVAARILGTIDA
jgi:pimeloyl-ACP methyl ester carboxylesterase